MATNTPAQSMTLSFPVFKFFTLTPMTLSCLTSRISVVTESQTGLIFGLESVRPAMIFDARNVSRR